MRRFIIIAIMTAFTFAASAQDLNRRIEGRPAADSPVLRTIVYTPEGVCSKKITIIMDENQVLQEVHFQGGCSGNAEGINRLVRGMKASEAIERLKGTPCGKKGTSCPDQLAKALEEALKEAIKK